MTLSAPTPLTEHARRPRLTSARAESLVRRWHRSLTDRRPLDELTAHLTNGLRLDLPSGVVRGVEGFRRWYEAGDLLPLAGHAVALTGVDVRLLSPLHAEVTTTTITGPGAVPTRHEWWVVRQPDGPRIRTISVRQPAVAPAAARTALLSA
ncbi:hypothetical protein [Streptomyces hainanensis]|uniref:Nuclear transport factor 2 family protein n=1 Tax=Streptomyces hainanensis TaxID=402648 RepID=A0A4R4SIM0_9ACTN|nr:hypothetical protein [Streptomyces hainanensis]TDC62576.1 hypothetical protein E1283_33855 [Streptomyces hainanensis]